MTPWCLVRPKRQVQTGTRWVWSRYGLVVQLYLCWDISPTLAQRRQVLGVSRCRLRGLCCSLHSGSCQLLCLL